MADYKDLIELLRAKANLMPNTEPGAKVALNMAADALESESCESGRWKELCASMLIHVEPGAGRRRAESYEVEYNDLVSEKQCQHKDQIQYGREIECVDCGDKWEEPQI